jgi:hypothetical protein
MATRKINGNTYSEFAVVAGEPLPVRTQGDPDNPVPTIEGLSIPEHDYISLSYTGENLTGVVYKSGGSSGETVATLTLTYDGNSNLTSVTKS